MIVRNAEGMYYIYFPQYKNKWLWEIWSQGGFDDRDMTPDAVMVV